MTQTANRIFIELDATTERMLAMLRADLNAEPTVPDVDKHESHQFAELALVHYEWQRKIDAWRLLIGVRLTNTALADWVTT